MILHSRLLCCYVSDTILYTHVDTYYGTRISIEKVKKKTKVNKSNDNELFSFSCLDSPLSQQLNFPLVIVSEATRLLNISTHMDIIHSILRAHPPLADELDNRTEDSDLTS